MRYRCNICCNALEFDQCFTTVNVPYDPRNGAGSNMESSIVANSSDVHDHNSSNICQPLHVTPLIITAGIFSCGIIVGNSLVIIAIVGGNAKFFRPMFWFIIHLSSSDLSVGVMLLWNYCLAAIFKINNTITSLSVLQAVWVTSSCSSVLGILMLAVDRYMQVVHNRLHNKYFNQLTVGIAICFAWLIPIFLFLVAPIALGWSCQDGCHCSPEEYIDCTPFPKCSQVVPPFTKSYILIGLIYLFFIMPWPILVYILIFFKARKSTQALPRRMRHRDFRLIRTLVVIMLTFIITLTPAGVVMIIDYITIERNKDLVDYALYAFTVSTINSLLNPILYIWRIPAIRVSLEQRFKCCCKSKSASSESKTMRIGGRLHGHSNSEQAIHSDIVASPRTPLDNVESRKSTFIFCGKRFSSNFSDVSQSSTPTSQRSPRKKAKMVKMQTFSSDLRSHTSSRSPHGTSYLVTEDTENGALLMAKKSLTENGSEAGPDTCAILLHRGVKFDDDEEIISYPAAP